MFARLRHASSFSGAGRSRSIVGLLAFVALVVSPGLGFAWPAHPSAAATPASASAGWRKAAEWGTRGDSEAQLVSTTWQYAGISSSQRTLRTITAQPGCGRSTSSRVEETQRSVRIYARNLRPNFPPGTSAPPCAVGVSVVLVTLKAPLAGRLLLGRSRGDSYLPDDSRHPLGVVGLAPNQALRILRDAGYRPKVAGDLQVAGRQRVVTQDGNNLVIGGRSPR